MELKQALENIKRVKYKLPEEEILCIREHKDQAIPTLLEYVKFVSDVGEDIPEDYSAHDIAMFLLAEFRVRDAFPYLVRYLEFDRDFTDILLGDLITEQFGAVLASVATAKDIPRIKDVIENTNLDEFQRLAAANALQTLYAEDVYDRNDYFAYLRHLLETYQNDMELLTFIVIDCEDTGHPEFIPLIESLFEAGLIDEHVTTLSHIKKKLLITNEISAKQALKTRENSSFVKDTIKSIGWWACFREKPNYGRKVGRNEPCPCGSGKKYKKCCSP